MVELEYTGIIDARIENKTERIIAITAFDNGPANAIFITSVFGLRKFCSWN